MRVDLSASHLFHIESAAWKLPHFSFSPDRNLHEIRCTIIRSSNRINVWREGKILAALIAFKTSKTLSTFSERVICGSAFDGRTNSFRRFLHRLERHFFNNAMAFWLDLSEALVGWCRNAYLRFQSHQARLRWDVLPLPITAKVHENRRVRRELAKSILRIVNQSHSRAHNHLLHHAISVEKLNHHNHCNKANLLMS